MRLHANARLTPEGRGLLCRRVCEQGWWMAEACAAAGVSVRAGYAGWPAGAMRAGPAVDRPSVAHRLAHATDPARVRAILALRGLRMTGCRSPRRCRWRPRRSRASSPAMAAAGGRQRARRGHPL